VNDISIQITLELIQLDLFESTKKKSISSKRFGLAILDYYIRWTRVKFLN